MYQEIVVSPTIFQEILDSHMDIESLQELLFQLATEEILSDADSVILNEYRDIVESEKSDWYKKSFLQNMLSAMVQKVRRQKYIVVQNRNENEYHKYETEIRLAKGSKWEIILSALRNNNSKEDIYNKYNIELSDIENYLLPNYTSRIRTQEKIEMHPGGKFNLHLWIDKYIRDAKYLIIEDSYMCCKPARDNLFNILSRIETSIKVKLVTLSDEERNKYNKYGNDNIDARKELEKIAKELDIKNSIIRPVENKNDLRDRHLETDKFEVDLGHALDGIDPNTSKVHKHFRMTVTRRKNINN